MAFTAGDPSLEAHYDTFVGVPTGTPSDTNKALQPFVSDVEGDDKVAAIVGVGYGIRGYGQTAYTLPNVATGDSITSANWTHLRNAIQKAADHQGTATTNLYPTTSVNVGDVITAFDGGVNKELASIITAVDAAAITFDNDSGASMSLSTNVLTNTRATSWSTSITHTGKHAWSSDDECRWFFNSGGEIRVTCDHPSTSGSQNTDWNDVLANVVGTFAMGATSCSRTGSGGTINTTLGYYDLTASYQTLYDGTNIGGGSYSANDVTIEARIGGATTNGAPGDYVEIQITLNDQHTGTSDTVASGTNAVWDIYKATVELTGIETPTTTNAVGF